MRAGRFSGWLGRGWAAWTARSRLVRAAIAVVVLAPLVAVGQWVMSDDHRPTASKGQAVKGVHDVHFGKPDAPGSTVPNATPGKERWPAVATADATLDPGKIDPRNPGSGRVRAGRTPVWFQPVLSKDATYTGPSKLTVKLGERALADHLSVRGLVFTATAHGGSAPQQGSGPVRVGVDYNWLTTYFGKNWAAGLRLVQLPGCALSTPEKPECRTRTPLPASGINVPRQHVYAQPSALGTDGSTMVLALATDTPISTGGSDGGTAGSNNPTDLKPSGSWTSGGSKGTFTYNYPVAVPPVATGSTPKLSLDYDSGDVDGQTSATDSQANWLGDGWTTPNSFVEQTYTGCSDKPEGTDAPKKTGDLCYAGPILSMVLDGRTVQIVAQGGTYVVSDANGDRVEHITNSNNGTGTYNTDYWRVTDRKGTQYYFGRNQLPGWSAGKAQTNSVDWEPVFSAHKPDGSTYTDPCWDSASFEKSVCKMAYRWHLDYVVDAHGNAMSYYYKQDTNSFTQNAPLTTTDPASIKANADYVRDSHLDHIDYGFRDGQAYSINSGKPPAQVLFKTGPRCVTGTCDFPTPTSRNGWLDTPNTLICKIGDRCLVGSPTHWSTVRLTEIDTQQWNGQSYTPVDSWKFGQSMPDPGDGSDPTLWLASISHTGADATAGGTTATLPDLTFTPQQLQNRVDKDTNGYGPLNRMRINAVTTETGSVISVNYFQARPCSTPSSLDPATNTTSCFPVYWTPPYGSKPYRDWFNTYQVQSVTQTTSVGTDPTGKSPTMYTGYNYLGGGGWHFDDNEVVKPKFRTYGQWRGFGRVQTFTGQADGPQTESETLYYRGMSKTTITGAIWNVNEGGWDPSTADGTITFTGDVGIPDSQGKSHADLNQLAGRPLETTTYNWAGGSSNIVGSTITSYWVSTAIASRKRNALPDLTATAIGEVESWSRQKVSASPGWRLTETDTGYDTDASSPTFGMPLHTYEHGDVATTDQRRCTTTSYAPYNSANNLAGLPAEVITVAKACGGSNPNGASVPDDGQVNALTMPATYDAGTELVSDVKTIYDDDTLGKALPTDLDPGSKSHPLNFPSVGNVSEVRAANYDPTSGQLTWQIKSATNYDASGVVTDSWDAAGAHTHIEHTPLSGVTGVTAQSVTTNPLGQKSTLMLDPARGVPVKAIDLNGITTNSTYDGLGRLTAVWTNSRATTQPANLKYSYQITNSGTSSITTQTVNDANGYALSTQLFDAMLRPIQTQKPTPQGGRILTNTFYDSHGWTWKANAPYWDSGTAPNTTLAAADDAKIPNQTVTDFDGLGRTILATSYYQSQGREQTATVYLGDKTITVPPAGGVATQTVTDAANRTVELDNFTARPTVTVTRGSGTTPVAVSVADGSITASNGRPQAVKYDFDLRGNQTDITNKASTDIWHSDYNTAGQPVTKKDPDAGTSTLTYDALGRLVKSTDGNGATLSLTYDLLGRKIGSFHGASPDPAKQIASWTYDNINADGKVDISGLSNPIGQMTSSTRYDVAGNTTDSNGRTGKQRGYTTHVTDGYDNFGQPLGTTVALPDSEGVLKGDHTVLHDYTDRVGLHLDDYYAADGPLPEETVNVGWSTVNGLDLQGGTNGNDAYAAGVRYTAYSQVAQVKTGASSKPAFLTDAYDEHTGRLLNRQFAYPDRSTVPIDEDRYVYDPAGNPTRQTTVHQGTQSETQCFGYDALNRLAQAWTATDDCAADPATNKGTTVGSGISGGAYWTSWDLDPLGLRRKETRYGLSGNGDTVTTYAYGGEGNPQPHTLTSLTTTTAAKQDSTPVVTQKQSFGYDKDGNTTQRTSVTNPDKADQSTNSRTYGWTDQGELSSVTADNSGPSYLYDADGQLLLQKDPAAGTTTLHLAGEQLTLNTATGKLSGIRYYPQPGGITGVRTIDYSGTQKVTFETADPHGTGDFTIDPDWNQTAWKQTTPYGAPRGNAPTFWPDNHGFLGKVEDKATSLTDVGARWYDPDLGRFISLDSLQQATSQQEQNGYTYGADNPVTNADPSGLCNRPTECEGVVNPGHKAPMGHEPTPHCGDPGIYCGPSNSTTSGDGNQGGGGGGGGGGSNPTTQPVFNIIRFIVLNTGLQFQGLPSLTFPSPLPPGLTPQMCSIFVSLCQTLASNSPQPKHGKPELTAADVNGDPRFGTSPHEGPESLFSDSRNPLIRFVEKGIEIANIPMVTAVTAGAQWLDYGASCSNDTQGKNSNMMVCKGGLFDKLIPQGRSGFTIGFTYFATKDESPEPEKLHHESVHRRQWLDWGPAFPLVYFGQAPFRGTSCGNTFEQAAGLDDGGYRC